MHICRLRNHAISAAVALALTWSAAFAAFAATVALALSVTDANAATLTPTTAHDDIPGDATLKQIVEGAGATEALEAEAEARKTADATMQTAIDNEAESRSDKDSEIVESVTNLSARLTEEIGAREDGDTWLYDQMRRRVEYEVYEEREVVTTNETSGVVETNVVIALTGDSLAKQSAVDDHTAYVSAVLVDLMAWEDDYLRTKDDMAVYEDGYRASEVRLEVKIRLDGDDQPATYNCKLVKNGEKESVFSGEGEYEDGIEVVVANDENDRLLGIHKIVWKSVGDFAENDDDGDPDTATFSSADLTMADGDEFWFDKTVNIDGEPLTASVRVRFGGQLYPFATGGLLATQPWVEKKISAGVSDFVTEKKLEELGFSSASPSLTTNQTAAGVTYEKGGHDQNTAVAIGKGARAALPAEYVSSLTNATVLRSVSVAIGGYADANSQSASRTNNSQAIAIGYCSQAKANNAIAIGSGAQHTNETAMSGGATVANAGSAVAIGYSAKATAAGAWQFGLGTNSTQNSLKFGDTYVVRDGKLAVQADVRTNDVQSIIRDALAPQTLCDWDASGGVVTAKTHTITTLSPTNAMPDEIELDPSASRNYEIYIPNTEQTRQCLPASFDTSSETAAHVTKIGAWWRRKATRLPLLVKVREPLKDVVVLDAETYDDGTDWTPVVTNAVWRRETGADGEERLTLDKVRGVNLHRVAGADVSWVTTNGVTNVVSATEVKNPVYGLAYPTFAGWAGIPAAEVAEGTEPAVSVYEADVAPAATINALREAVKELVEQKKGWR